MEICKRELCTGCGACAALCPAGCIEMKEDEIGHLYPFIHKEKCTGCNQCRKRCPVMNKPKAYPTGKAYACWSLDGEDRKSSTSGGFASVASEIIIEKGGVVYGSALMPDGIKHIRVSDEGSLKKLKGSKYVQSPIDEIYKPLLKDLESGLEVLLVGTPCQTAGVKAYLGKEYDNLLLIDLICTGVPPQKLLWEHLGYSGKKPDEISFRKGLDYYLTLAGNGKVIYKQPVYNDYFYMGFSKHLYFRESCYRCPFADKERTGDITVGDFWGLGQKEPFAHDVKDGVSLVLPHNEKGMNLLEKCRPRLFLTERTAEEALEFNRRYYSPSQKHKNADLFKKLYIKKGFKYALKKALVKERMRYFAYRRLVSLKKLVRKY